MSKLPLVHEIKAKNINLDSKDCIFLNATNMEVSVTDVKFNSNITDFPLDKNLNIGKTCLTRFVYKFNSEGYFSKLKRLLPGDGILPLVNSTMSKKIKKIIYK